jgi:hypothetical protein
VSEEEEEEEEEETKEEEEKMSGSATRSLPPARYSQVVSRQHHRPFTKS